MDLLGIHLTRPLWLLAWLPALALAWLALHQRSNAVEWRDVLDRALHRHLLQRSGTARLPLGLLLLGWTVVILAMAGPAWDRLPQALEQKQEALIMMLDLSPSMFAEDIQPSRLERARNKLRDVLEHRDEGVTALVAYGGDAFTITPLTDDTETVGNLLNSLSPQLIPDAASGSNPAAALQEADRLLQDGGVGEGRVLWVTDGIRNVDLPKIERELENGRLRLSVLGIGSRSGAPVKLPGGDFLRNASGQPVVASLDPTPLRRLVAAHGGRYHTLTVDDSDIDYLMDTGAASGDTRSSDRELSLWREQGPWLILLLLPLAALSGFRRGWLLLLLLTLGAGSLPAVADAFAWKDLWSRQDQQAAKLLQQGDAAAAADSFADSDWQATALYKAERYEEALERWPAETDHAATHFNRGNALAYSAQLQAAIRAYQAALELDPKLEEARYNIELLQDILSGAKRQPGPPQPGQEADGEQSQQQPSGEQQQGQSGPPQGDDAQQESGSEGQEQQAGDPGQQQDAESSESSDEFLQHSADRAEQDQEQDAEQQGSAEAGEEQQQEDEQQTGTQDGENGEEAQQAQQQQEDGQGDADGENPGEPQPPKDLSQWLAESGEADQTEEQRQAMEMWLRQIPEDPAGLLRNKLRYQQLQRQQRGESRADRHNRGL